MSVWEAIGDQLRRPSGPLAHLVGGAMRVVNRRPYRLAIAALDVQPDDRVLELGSGPGEGVRALSALARRGTVWGIDHSPAMVAQAARRNAKAVARDQVELRLAGFDALPLDDASIDRVLAVNVAYFWGDGEAVLREIGRVLMPGGRLSVYVTEAAAMEQWKFAGRKTHMTFTAESLRLQLCQAPFDACRVRVDSKMVGFGIRALVATAER